jgi:hypothetical protein
MALSRDAFESDHAKGLDHFRRKHFRDQNTMNESDH